MDTQPTADATGVQANIDLVRETYDCFFKGDIETLMEKYTEDVHWEVYGPPSLPTAGPRIGKEALKLFFGQVAELLESNKFEVQEYIAQGDTVVSLGEYNWTSRITGKQMEAHFVHAVTVRDGKICKFREYTDTHAAVAAMT